MVTVIQGLKSTQNRPNRLMLRVGKQTLVLLEQLRESLPHSTKSNPPDLQFQDRVATQAKAFSKRNIK